MILVFFAATLGAASLLALPTALRLPIDHLLYTDGLRVIDRRLGPPAGSDHCSVVVDLAITS